MTSTEPIKVLLRRLRYVPPRIRSPIWAQSSTSAYAEEIGSAESSTNTHIALELNGRGFRPEQSCRRSAGAVAKKMSRTGSIVLLVGLLVEGRGVLDGAHEQRCMDSFQHHMDCLPNPRTPSEGYQRSFR
jgi:hypothetical protein